MNLATVPRSPFLFFDRIIAAFMLLPLAGCGGRQKTVPEPPSCKQELNECQYSLENYKAQNRSASESAAPLNSSLVEWRAAFSEISANVEAMFRSYDHRIEVDNGGLVLALPIEMLFQLKKATLTEKGKEIALRINQIAKQIEGRGIVITCRSVDYRGTNPNAPAATDRELSFKRAMTFTTKLVKTGVDPTTLGAAGYPGEVDPETGEGDGWFELTVLPHPHEMPVFPDDFLNPGHASSASNPPPADW